MRTTIYFLFILFFANVSFTQLQVSGKFLQDQCGENIVLVGVNTMSHFVLNPENQFAEIAQTGANSVRIQIEPGTPLSAVQQWIEACMSAQMIPILEPQSWTGESNGDPAGFYGYGQSHTTVFNQIAAFWTSANLKSLLLQYQDYIIINIANEPDGSWAIGSDGDYEDATNQAILDRESYFNANKTAITALRNAGYTCPLMIDGPDNAHDVKFHTLYADLLQQHDPIHTLIFSVHAYWPGSSFCTNSVSDAKIIERMNEMGALNQPIVMGELAIKNVCDEDPDNPPIIEPINYNLILQKLTEYHLGYHVWWWGGESQSNNALSMTNDGTYEGLNSDGYLLAVSHTNSIQNYSVKPYSLVHGGACEELEICEKVTNIVLTDNHDGTFTVNWMAVDNVDGYEVKIMDANNFQVDGSTVTSNSFTTSVLSDGTYSATIYTICDEENNIISDGVESDAITLYTVGLNEEEFGTLNLFPNPSSTTVYVTLEGASTIDAFVVLNPIGQVVYKSNIFGNNFQLNVNHFATGIHHINVMLSNGEMIMRNFSVVR